jgi:hypothetical protein
LNLFFKATEATTRLKVEKIRWEAGGAMALQSAYYTTFNGDPIVLLWGDAAGMRALSALLRKMLVVPDTMTLSEFCQAADDRTITVRMRASRRDTGMRLIHKDLEWTLRPQSADDFAALVEALAASGKSGHHYLTCGVTDEITVMVSQGEYPEDLRP